MSALTLPSAVTAVTVFRQGAVVTRTATLRRPEAGFPELVRLDGLPLLLDDDSLQVEVQPVGEGSAPVAGELRVTLAVPEPDEDLRPPTDEELEAATLELSLARRAGADLGTIRGHLTTMTPRPRGTPEDGAAPMASPTDARMALLALRRERLERLRPQIAEAAARIRSAEERVETLRERERRASQARNPRTFEARKAVVVGLLPAEHPVEQLELRLRYFVPGARWAPSYVLRLDPSLERGTLELRALVGQVTGERWSDVALTLSTANPQQWTELPELKSLRIGRRQPPVAKTGWRPPPSGTDLLYADYDRLTPPPLPTSAGGPARTAAPPPPPPPSPVHTQTGITQTGAFDADFELAASLAEEASRDFALPEKAKKKRGSGPPPGGPPVPQSMPMPMAPAAAMPVQSRSSGFGAMLGSAIDGLIPAGGGGGAPMMQDKADDAYEGAPTTLSADRALLEYGGLWLPPPEHDGRGSLQRADRARRYGHLTDLSAAQIVDALSRIEHTRSRAAVLESRTPPGGHRWVHATEGFDYAYRADARISLDSDGELHSLALSSPDVQTHPRYICVPRETSDVFRVVVLRNPIDAPLLPGPVDVYLGGRFALASELETTPPGGRVELGLGVEQAIKVARNVAFDDESSGLLKRHRELEHRVRVEVRNNLAQPAQVELRERLPVLEEDEDDIELSVRSVEPEWDELEQEDPPLEGGRRWRVEVPAGGERRLEAVWSIRIPQNHELVGGNRREG